MDGIEQEFAYTLILTKSRLGLFASICANLLRVKVLDSYQNSYQLYILRLDEGNLVKFCTCYISTSPVLVFNASISANL